MADGDGGGGEGSGSAEWQPIYDRVQAWAEALAADRALLEAASKVQRESWEAARRLQRSVEELQAAAREKDAENGRLRAEAADAIKKLQANASRKMRWEAAYVELLLGANQKLAELRDGDMEDSRARAEDPNSMEVQGCGRLSQNTADQARVATDLSTKLKMLKQAYEALSSKKDKEVSALLSDKELMCNQLDIMEQDYDALVRNKKGEAAQAIEAAQKLQRSVDGLKVLAKKKDDEIGRLRAKAVAAEKKLHTAQKLRQSVDDLKVLAQKKDDEIGRLRADAVAAEKNLQKMHSLVKEKDDEIQGLKGRHPESIKKRNKDICETHKNFRSDDPAVTVRGSLKNDGLRQMVEEDYISETEMVEKDEQDENSQKRRSNDDAQSASDADDDEQNGSDEDGDEQSGSDEDGDKQSGSDEDGNQQSRSEDDDDDDDDDDGQSKSDERDEDEEDDQSGRDVETTNNAVQKPLGNLKRKRDVRNAQIANGKSPMESNGVSERSLSYESPEPLLCRRLVTTQDRRCVLSSGSWAQYVSDVKDSLADQPVKLKLFLWFLCNFKNWTIDFAASSIKAVLNGHPKLICRFNEFFPSNLQIEEKDSTHMSSRVAKRRRSYEPPPGRLRLRKLVVPHWGSSVGRVYMPSGNWAQFASDVKDSFADQPERHDCFLRCLSKRNEWSPSIGDVARAMKYVLRGYPELIRGFNRFLPLHREIEVEEDEENQHPKWRPWNYQRRGQGQPMSKGAQHQPVMKLKEKEQQPKKEPV